MRIETTRSTVSVRLLHGAGFFDSDAHLMSQLVPVALAGLRRGEPVALALRPGTEEALRDAIGSPAGLVPLAQPDGPDAGSGQTLIMRWARELRELGATTGGPVTVVSEHIAGLDGADGSFWTELDAAANVALAALPVSLTCFYPELPVHQEVLAGARRNHPLLLVRGELRHNPDHRRPRDVLTARPAPAPMLLGPPELSMTFSAWQLHEVRAAVEQAALGAGYGRSRTEDIVLAVNEVATNAVEHGATEAQIHVWTGPDGFACEVHDRGTLRDPLPGLHPPHPSDPRGRGVWIARQLCDLLHVWRDDFGTHVRMRAIP